MMVAQITDKTAIVAHYVIARARPDQLGATKLNKVMWYADIQAYRRLGHTVTGQMSYEKRQFGPVPNNIFNATRELEHDGAIVARPVSTPVGPRKEWIWLKEPPVAELSSEEVDILNSTIEWVCSKHSAGSISDLSHDALWREIDLGEQIPIRAASVREDEATADDLAWALAGLSSAPFE